MSDRKPAPAVHDQRFQKVHNDPRFARTSKRKNKLQLDKRFAGALKDKRFQSVQGKYDKYGRRIENRGNELQKFYRLEDDEEQDSEEGDEQTEDVSKTPSAKGKGKGKAKKQATEEDEEEGEEAAQRTGASTTSSDDDNDEADATVAKNNEKLSRLDYLNAMARGELASGSDSSDSDDSDSDEEDEEALAADATARKEEQEDIPMGEETKRFAVLNCDWTRIRAVDLFALFQSFAPPTGAVENVTIYPSDYGLEKMKEEAEHGPQGLWDEEDRPQAKTEGASAAAEEASEDGTEAGEDSKSEEQEGEENVDEEKEEEEEDYDSDDPLGVKKSVTLEGESDGFDREKLRKYELQKLRYYYAVVTCDSVKTASTIFDQCDQLEYETSSNVLDLRFVPDDVSFENTPKESCDSVPDRYKPAIFATLALQQTDVKLTWEEDDDQRLELLTRPAEWKDAHEDDFAAYLASDASSSSEVDDDSEEEEEEEEVETSAKPSSRSATASAAPADKKKSAKLKKLRNRYRSMLLGSDAEDEDGGSDADGNADSDASSSGEKDADENMDEGDMEMSFTPGAGDVLRAKRQKELEANETPFERYAREKKQEKNRKLHEKRAKKKELAREQREVLKKKGRGSSEAKLLREAIADGPSDGEGDGELSDAGQAERNFDMKKIAKQEKVKSLKGKRRAKELRKLAKQQAAGGLQEGFAFDAADPRFDALYAKGSHFQLDPTDPKFRKSEATQAIFQERRQRYDEASKAPPAPQKEAESATTGGKHELKAMVENLKRKSQMQGQKKAKKHKKVKA